MRNVLIVDTETTGVDRERDQVIEIGYVLWSVEHRTMLESYSGLLHATENSAEAVNGIPAAALPSEPWNHPWILLGTAAARADAFVAHQADFDRAFLEPRLADFDTGAAKPWICTREDMLWPRASTGTSLIATALAHGVAVVAAHRAISDCQLIARLFEVVPDISERLEAALAHALLPKHRYVALVPYEQRELAKEAGFKWDPQRREWWRVLAEPDAAALAFKTRVVLL